MDNDDVLYNALTARDTRFDGVFFTGVTTTRIYCRPVCPARTPRRANCRFFSNAAAAEQQGFRPCLRCRPELAPGCAPIDDAARIAGLLVERLGELDAEEEGRAIARLADEFEIGPRQFRRIVQAHFGVAPMELVQTRRMLLAKQLLTETRLKVIDVAFACGFTSLRRFNDAFAKRYRMPPTALRRAAREDGEEAAQAPDQFTISLGYRPPMAWDALLAFLATRAIGGVEAVTATSYARTIALDGATGWFVACDDAARCRLRVTVSAGLLWVLPKLIARVRLLFDLSAQPAAISAHLAGDARLSALVAREPGLRVPGAVDPFELAVRAVLGQQVSVAAASTLATRWAERFGKELAAPVTGLRRLTPQARTVARAEEASITQLGVTKARAAAIIGLAREFDSGRLEIRPGADPRELVERLGALPGIGPWTAQYIAMRALGWPDAFPKEDMVLRRRLGGLTSVGAEQRAEPWRPWRSYAVMHLWREAGQRGP